MNFGDFFHDIARKVPGQSWLSSTRGGDIVSGGLFRGLERNNWRFPVGHDTSSFDDLAGAGASSSHGLRNLARGTGALFGGGALYGAYDGAGAAAGEGAGGASEVGYGFPLAEEAGGAGAGGQLSGPGASMGWQDYLRRYGQEGMNLLSSGDAGGSRGTPEDSSMIAPIPIHDEFAQSRSELPAGLLELLLAQQASNGGDTHEARSYASSRGLA